MRLQFKIQQYQTDAVEAVVRCFAGQPKQDRTTYRIDRSLQSGEDQQLLDLRALSKATFRNAEIQLSKAELLANLHEVQRSRNLSLSPKLASSKAAPDGPNLDVEMETGTGKTYVYIKTLMELHQRYGWSKFIVVVPSVAIREGVKKSFDITADHFLQSYGTKARSFIYNSSQLYELERFSSDGGVQVMIINIQAFNATGKDNRRIYEILDDFQSRRPIDVIATNRPIVVIDEPQKIGTRSLDALSRFNALMALRYSATHKIEHNKIHRLDALDAYNQKLVKKIAVRGITVKGLASTTAYLYLQAIEITRGAGPRACVEIEVQTKAGLIKRQVKRLDVGANLYDASGGIEAYRRLLITDIDVRRDVIELSNGDVVFAGQLADRDVTEESKRRIQIREVIGAHIDKERELFTKGIKVLSLFFIDEVVKYRDYSCEDTLGDYARVFEEEYLDAVGAVSAELALDDATASYQAFLQRHEVRTVHEGYFSIDKKSQRLVDPRMFKRGEDKGHSADVDAYDLILKNKERLLSLSEPVRFIFSHSALREGWDNPNVFVMGMLKKSDNIVSRRQEIGRGLRLAVNQDGERMDNPVTVHEINELTVVTDESYTDFVAGLQREIGESLSARPRRATPEFFAGKVVDMPDGSGQHVITLDEAKQLQHWLTVNGFIDYEQHLTDKWLNRASIDIPALPAGLNGFHYQVAYLIDSLHVDFPEPIDGRKPKPIPLNQTNFTKKEFSELWDRINPKAVYQVKFDTSELVAECVDTLNGHLHVTPMQYMVQSGRQLATLEAEDLAEGRGFNVGSTTTLSEAVAVSSQVQYDLLGEICDRTQLSRRTVSAILRGIEEKVFAKYRQNPVQFMAETARLINEQKATVIVEHLSYDAIAERHTTAIFTENQTKQNLSMAGAKLTKHIYDYVITDSKVEREFVIGLDASTEVVVYAKLPTGFFIPTPIGNYNPDWAIAFREGTVKHVYFVAETKGSLSSLQLKGAESIKIECARKFFESLNANCDPPVGYDVVTSYAELMSFIGQV